MKIKDYPSMKPGEDHKSYSFRIEKYLNSQFRKSIGKLDPIVAKECTLDQSKDYLSQAIEFMKKHIPEKKLVTKNNEKQVPDIVLRYIEALLGLKRNE